MEHREIKFRCFYEGKFVYFVIGQSMTDFQRTINGYVLIWFPEHPNANIGRTRSYVPEHRMIMSEIIGRPLLRTEQVHHKNGIRDDNRPENLELWTTSQPSGQRVEDRIKWAKEFLSLYENPDLLK